jgi:hypothetical protein
MPRGRIIIGVCLPFPIVLGGLGANRGCPLHPARVVLWYDTRHVTF